MPHIAFTPHLERYLDCATVEVEAATVGDALRQVFARNPRLEGYVLDEQGRLRQHVAIFVSGRLIEDRLRLSDALDPDEEVYVMQALSGG